jgi:hypothetical protein
MTTLNGELVDEGTGTTAESRRNSTLVTPVLSLAEPDSVTEPDSVEPFAGERIVTVGAISSRLETFSETGFELPT